MCHVMLILLIFEWVPIFFCTEMAERHDAKAILHIARSLILQLQTLIENKWNESLSWAP